MVWLRPLAGRRPRAVAASARRRVGRLRQGVSRVLDFDRHLFVNTDLTIHLPRRPVGEWVLLDVRTRVEPAGVGVAASTLYDGRGSIGLVAQSLYVAERDEAAGRPRWPSGGARGRVAPREMFLRLLLAYLFRRMVGGGGRRRGWPSPPPRYGYRRRRSSRFGFFGPFPTYSTRPRGGSRVTVSGCCLPIPLALVLGAVLGARSLPRR